MIVYVESNFILEIALQQSQSSSAFHILHLAQQEKIALKIPCFALSEPFSTVMHRNGERKKVSNVLTETFNEIRRSKHHDQIEEHFAVMNVLKHVEQREWNNLHESIGQVLESSVSLPFDARCLKQALRFHEMYDLSPQDAIIYASILMDLQVQSYNEKKCFLSRDQKAFNQKDDRGIKAELEAYTCCHIGSFIRGFEYIQHTLKSAG